MKEGKALKGLENGKNARQPRGSKREGGFASGESSLFPSLRCLGSTVSSSYIIYLDTCLLLPPESER